MVVSFQSVEEFPGWAKAPEFFESLLSRYNSKRILEVGSGANPTLDPEFIRKNNLAYITSDVDPEELQKADPAFERLVVDLSVKDVDPALVGSFDCILSRMVGEHVSDGRQYHANIHKMLRPGGISAHCFSTLWSLPFATNRFLPEWVGDQLLRTFAPRDRHQHGKFKAYYSWSRGPSKSMIRRFESLGFEIIRYTGYFGHHYYRRGLRMLQPLEALKSKLLVEHPIPQLCSYSTLILRKPERPTVQDRP
jgi:2-polyprenyl-3-methyl-5-hydroxy-6-metoxy-1,4-benzoquinol methylase